jgi:putative transposase
MAGIAVELEDERYTTQKCPNPNCPHKHKPKGRNYRCPECKLQAHRDVVGAINILSKHLLGELGKLLPPNEVKYRQPFRIERSRRSPQDTGQVAVGLAVVWGSQKEAVPL